MHELDKMMAALDKQSSVILTGYLVLFGTFALIVLGRWSFVAQTMDLYMTIAAPFFAVVCSAMFGFKLYTRGHFFHLATGVLLSLLLGGYYVISTL